MNRIKKLIAFFDGSEDESSVDPSCICPQVEYIYGDWERRTKGMKPSERNSFSVLHAHLEYIQTSMERLLQPGQSSVTCSIHGVPLFFQRAVEKELNKSRTEEACQGENPPSAAKIQPRVAASSPAPNDSDEHDIRATSGSYREPGVPREQRKTQTGTDRSKKATHPPGACSSVSQTSETSPKTSQKSTPAGKTKKASHLLGAVSEGSHDDDGSMQASPKPTTAGKPNKASQLLGAASKGLRDSAVQTEMSPELLAADEVLRALYADMCSAELGSVGNSSEEPTLEISEGDDKASKQVKQGTSKLQKKVDKEMSVVKEQKRSLEDMVQTMDARKLETEQAMAQHIKRLHDSIDFHHHQALKAFHEEQEKYYFGILQHMLELDNFSSKLAGLQAKEEEILAKGPAGSGNKSAAQSIGTLHNELQVLVGKRPQQQVLLSPTYNVVAPQDTDAIISDIVGSIRVSEGQEEPNHTSSPKTTHIDYAGDRTSSAGSGASASQTPDSKRNAPADTKAAEKTPAASTRMGEQTGPGKHPECRKRPETPWDLQEGEQHEAIPDAGIHRAGARTYAAVVSSSGGVQDRNLESEKAKKISSKAAASQKAPEGKQTKKKRKKKKNKKNAPRTWAESDLDQDSESEVDEGQNTFTVKDSYSKSSSAESRPELARSRASSGQHSAEDNILSKETKLSEETKVTKPLSFYLRANAFPTAISGRRKQPTAMSVRKDGNIWVVYGSEDPHLDLLDEHGHILDTVHIGGNATGVAAYGSSSVCFVSQLGLSFILFKAGQPSNLNKTDISDVSVDINPTSIAVGTTGVVVSGKRSLRWVGHDVDETQWIVPDTQKSYLQKVCATAVAICEGTQIVCAADKSGQSVYFYRKDDKGKGFGPLAPYKGEHFPKADGQTYFKPISLSFHALGFLGILDQTSETVLLLEVDTVGAGQPLCLVSKSSLCGGVPTAIVLGPEKIYAGRPSAQLSGGLQGVDGVKLWVASTSGFIWHTSLLISYSKSLAEMY